MFKMNDESGQAVIEYLMVFCVLALITVKLVGYLSDYFGNTLGSLGYVISMKLSSGVCEANCWFDGFSNK